LSELGRLRLARCIVDDGWPVARAAERFQVARTTAARWAGRYRAEGATGMAGRSSRPQHSPRRTPAPVVRKIVHYRTKKRLGPVQIAPLAGVAPSTVHRVLVRCGLNRLSWMDRATGQAVRYEYPAPGGLVHVDIKKPGNIPAGGGWRALGRTRGSRNRHADKSSGRFSRQHQPLHGHACIHSALDDHSRLTYSEIHDDQTGQTAAAFWLRAHTWFTAHGITTERVLTGNGSCYRGFAWRDALAATGARHPRTRPYRPQTNGKIERFHRTLISEWAYARPYNSESARRAALPQWLHHYNHHRPHTALAGSPPISRCTNVPEQNS
jgi:hypothetical protein